MKKTHLSSVTKLLAVLLVLSMLASLVACAPDTPSNTPDDTTAGADVVVTTAPSESSDGDDEFDPIYDETEAVYETDSVEDYSIGETITILYWEDQEHEEFISEEQSADTILDSLYWRNQAVMNRLDVEFEYVPCLANASNINTWNNYIGNLQKSGDDSLDIMGGYSLSVAASVLNGYCYNLLNEDCDALTLDSRDSAWWPAALLEEAVINDKLFFCSGDISANLLYMMYTCFFNNNLVAEYGLENPHDLVANNEWTYEKFIEMCEGVYADTDGDGQKSAGDTFGYMTSGIHCDPWFYGTGINIVDTVDGEAAVSEEFITGTKVIAAAEMLNSLLWSSNYGIYTPAVNHQVAFNEDRLLFCIDRARISINRFDNGDLSYSVVPQPKFSADMDYVTVVGNPFTLYAIPSSCDNVEDVAAVMEVMASESYRQVTPAIFEITLKTKKVDDETSAEMYDLIRENVTFDIGRIFDNTLQAQAHFRNQLSSGSVTWASLMRSQKRALNSKMTTILEAYADD